MTPEQRELLDGWASKTKWATVETLEVAIRAALAENDALREENSRWQVEGEPSTKLDHAAIAAWNAECVAAIRSIDALWKDRERLTWLLEKQDRYLHDDIWEKACEACPVDFDEADKVAKWGRVGIDALMAIDATEVKP